MAKVNQKGRNKYDHFIKIDQWVLKTEAWKSLRPVEVAMYLLLLKRYNGRNNGRIALSQRCAAKEAHVAIGTARKALQTLAERGFIKIRYQGSFTQKLMRASEFELTDRKYGEALATKEFSRWRPEKIP